MTRRPLPPNKSLHAPTEPPQVPPPVGAGLDFVQKTGYTMDIKSLHTPVKKIIIINQDKSRQNFF